MPTDERTDADIRHALHDIDTVRDQVERERQDLRARNSVSYHFNQAYHLVVFMLTHVLDFFHQKDKHTAKHLLRHFRSMDTKPGGSSVKLLKATVTIVKGLRPDLSDILYPIIIRAIHDTDLEFELAIFMLEQFRAAHDKRVEAYLASPKSDSALVIAETIRSNRPESRGRNQPSDLHALATDDMEKALANLGSPNADNALLIAETIRLNRPESRRCDQPSDLHALATRDLERDLSGYTMDESYVKFGSMSAAMDIVGIIFRYKTLRNPQEYLLARLNRAIPVGTYHDDVFLDLIAVLDALGNEHIARKVADLILYCIRDTRFEHGCDVLGRI